VNFAQKGKKSKFSAGDNNITGGKNN